MKLSRVARYFNKSPFFDAYTLEEMGMCQLDLYDDSKRDGTTVQRRVVELAPSLTPPERGVILLGGTNWVIGEMMQDMFSGEIIRTKYVLQKSAGLSSVFTQESLVDYDLDSEEPESFVDAYCGIAWVRDAAELEISSSLYGRIYLYYNRCEELEESQIVELDGQGYIILALHPAASGYQVASCEILDKGHRAVATLETDKVWNPRTETWTSSTEEVPALLLRWQTDFDYFSKDTPTFERGDLIVALPVETTNGQEMTINDVVWRVHNVQFAENVYRTHLRRA